MSFKQRKNAILFNFLPKMLNLKDKSKLQVLEPHDYIQKTIYSQLFA